MMISEMWDVTNLVLLALTVAFLAILVYSKRETYTNLPPGPWGLPLIGNLLIFQKSRHVDVELTNLSKQYGNVMSLWLGQYRTFVLSGYDTIKEAIIDKSDVFSERPSWLSPKPRHAGIIFNKNWSDRRRFTLVSMRDFGLGKRSLDERMQEEASFLVEEIGKTNGQPVDLTLLLPMATANVICSIIIGTRYQYEDKDFKNLTKVLTGAVNSTNASATLLRFIPFLNRLPRRVSAIKGVRQHVLKWRVEHEESYDPDNIRDLIDLFIAEGKKEGSSFEAHALEICAGELFGAGTETTSTTLSWALLYLMYYTDIQKKCQEEINREIGSRPPQYEDMKRMPYTHAFMNEVQRMGNIVPLSLWHASKADSKLGGYTIPKESIIILNMRTALRDEKYFPDPDTFNPDRWLDDEGKITKNQAFIPFSTGKRVCLGEQLAKKEYFIFLTSMLQNFEFKMADEANPPSLEGIQGTIRSPGRYSLRAHKL